jgi:hypothetical protein
MISSIVNAFFAVGVGVGAPGLGLGVLAEGFAAGVPVAVVGFTTTFGIGGTVIE